MIGKLGNKKRFADFRRASQKICPDIESSVDQRRTTLKRTVKQVVHRQCIEMQWITKMLDFQQLFLVFHVIICYTDYVIRNRLPHICANRCDRGGLFFFIDHSAAPFIPSMIMVIISMIFRRSASTLAPASIRCNSSATAASSFRSAL